MNASVQTTGVLLFAHGARDAAWAQPFEAAAERLRKQAPQTKVALAFLEFMSPTILEAGHELVQQGCTQINVVPLFLGAGGHVRKDLPKLMDELRAQHAQVTWRLTRAVGETDLLIQALADSALALASSPDLSAPTS